VPHCILQKQWVMVMRSGMIILIIAVVLSALALVQVRFQNRVAFVELQKAIQERDLLHNHWEALLLEEGTWTAPGILEVTAQQQLGMIFPAAADMKTVYLLPSLSGSSGLP